MPKKAKEPELTVACSTPAEVYVRLEQMAAAKDRLSAGKPFDWATWYAALCAEKLPELTPAEQAQQARQIKEDGTSHHPRTWPWTL